jgi:hydroxymethylpyrimidine kinase/phosphomethylpyrimidine kinase
VILAFGGFDPTGGAGVLMDARAVDAAGGYAVAVASCLAIQTTTSFDRVVPLPRVALERSLLCAAKSFPIRAVKIGMVGTRTAAESLVRFLANHREMTVVLDPVLRSSTGMPLLAESALPAYRKLLGLATVLTPNLPEIEKILDRRVAGFRDAIVASRDLSHASGASVVLTGGHFPWPGKRGVDILYEGGRVTLLSRGKAFPRRNPHGTGCALAAGIATRLSAGDPLLEAVRTAKAILERHVTAGFPSAEGRWTLYAPKRGHIPARDPGRRPSWPPAG